MSYARHSWKKNLLKSTSIARSLEKIQKCTLHGTAYNKKFCYLRILFLQQNYCSSSPCPSGYRCQTGFTDKRYRCIGILYIYKAICRLTSTRSEHLSLLINLNRTKFVLISAFTLKIATWPKPCSKSRLKSAKRQLPVGIRGSKTLVLMPVAAYRQAFTVSTAVNIILKKRFDKILPNVRSNEGIKGSQ